jgi:hypothetical protein
MMTTIDRVEVVSARTRLPPVGKRASSPALLRKIRNYVTKNAYAVPCFLIRFLQQRHRGSYSAELAATSVPDSSQTFERRRMNASVLLVKAIGGGWDTSQLPRF